MNEKKFILLAVSIFLMSAQLWAQPRPNILIIVVDDMGVDTFAPYGVGTDEPNTSNLEALTNQGVLLMQQRDL